MTHIAYRLNHLKWSGLAAGAVFLIATFAAMAFGSPAAFVSYLWAYLFWFGLSLGCLNVSMIHHLTSGAWGTVTRRFFEAGYMTLPVMTLLFVPILFGLHSLYPWADPHKLADDHVLKQKAAYENGPMFLLRAIVFFAIWVELAVLLRKWSLQEDRADNAIPAIKARTLSGPGIAIVPLTATFAFVDWVMSLEGSWFSTIFAIILLASGILTSLAFGTIWLHCFQSEIPFAGVVTEKQFLDLGNLLLTFVMFWTYVAFSQLLVSYSGNQPSEISWYLHRIAGSWKWLILFIAAFQFFVPFLILLFRPVKQKSTSLAGVAVLIFFVSTLQIFWTVTPTFYPHGITIHWTDFAAWLGIGGIWMSLFAASLKQHPLLVRKVVWSETAIGTRHES